MSRLLKQLDDLKGKFKGIEPEKVRGLESGKPAAGRGAGGRVNQPHIRRQIRLTS
jgi:hypothetical protein